MDKELKFLEEKHGNNSWTNYPPSKLQVAQWLKEYLENELISHGISKGFYCWEKESIDVKCESVCDVCRGSKIKPN